MRNVMKRILILLGLTIVLSAVKAQKKQNVYFLKNDGAQVATKDAADYVRIIQAPDSGETYFNLQEFYVDGKQKTLGKVSAFDPQLVYQGMLIEFGENGKRKSIVTYKSGILLGMGYSYFSNGKLERQLEYLPYEPNLTNFMGTAFPVNSMLILPYKLIYQGDSLGNAFVKDGNGHLVHHLKIGKDEFVEEGNFKDGFKQGVWTGKSTSGLISFIETYEKNKLVSGISKADGITYSYTKIIDPPSYKGGIVGWYNDLSRASKYPYSGREEDGFGIVKTSYNIDIDGSITDVKIVESLYPALSEEAKRTLFNAKKWVPGKVRGIPVKVNHVLPFKYSLLK
jgi:antitoxin component YwqK of YwqJK toxin-antitoxin module